MTTIINGPLRRESTPPTTPKGNNWVWREYHRQFYNPRWHSYPNVTLWAIAWFQGGP